MGCCQGARKKALHNSCTKMQMSYPTANRMCGNNTLSKARDNFDELGANIVTYNGHRQNLQHVDNSNCLESTVQVRGGRHSLSGGPQCTSIGGHWSHSEGGNRPPQVWPTYRVFRHARLGERCHTSQQADHNATEEGWGSDTDCLWIQSMHELMVR
jgi:hypothetical protein